MIKSLIHIFVLVLVIAFGLSLQMARSEDPGAKGVEDNQPETPETPVELDNLKSTQVPVGDRPWQRPNFENQDSIRGYNSEEFSLSNEDFQDRVSFWIKIYTNYSTNQGVLHDTDQMNLIFSEIDFKDIDGQGDISGAKKRKLKEKLVDSKKDEIVDSIVKSQAIKDASQLSENEKKFWTYAQLVKIETGTSAAKIKKRIRFQLGQKDRFESAIFLSGRYLQDFEKIFEEEGLPKELTRIVFVESSFNVLARSKVGASGLWQIMPSTARPYKYIKPLVDYRNEPLQATRLAAKVLKQSYDLLESWPLAITGYNHGPSGVKKLVDKYKSRDLAHLIDNAKSRKSFGFASKNFYASFLAALEIEKNADKYFPQARWSLPLPVFQTRLSQETSLAEIQEWFGAQREFLELTNPHLSFVKMKGVSKVPQNTIIYFPEEKRAQLEDWLSSRKPSSVSSAR